MGKRYKNPPIIEVACEFRFQSGQLWDLALPGLIYQKLSSTFPRRVPLKGIEATVSKEESGILQRLTPLERLELRRQDDTALLQLGPNFLAVIHKKPYPGWEGFLPLIREAYEAYSEVAQPQKYQRIGLRYINRIEFDSEQVDLEKYFDFYPFLGSRLPQNYIDLFVGVLIPFENSRDLMRLELRGAPPSRPHMTALDLDMDYFLAEVDKIPLGGWIEWLEIAHKHVEEIFEGCIKDPLRERFEEVKF